MVVNFQNIKKQQERKTMDLTALLEPVDDDLRLVLTVAQAAQQRDQALRVMNERQRQLQRDVDGVGLVQRPEGRGLEDSAHVHDDEIEARARK